MTKRKSSKQLEVLRKELISAIEESCLYPHIPELKNLRMALEPFPLTESYADIMGLAICFFREPDLTLAALIDRLSSLRDLAIKLKTIELMAGRAKSA